MAPAPTSDDRAYVLCLTRRILGCDELAADAAQDELIAAYRARDQFRGGAAYRTWLHRIAVRAALAVLRRARRSPLAHGVTVPEPVDPGPGADDELARRRLRAQLTASLRELPEVQREVLELRAAGVAEAEIARRCGISVANVKIRAHRARETLRRALG